MRRHGAGRAWLKKREVLNKGFQKGNDKRYWKVNSRRWSFLKEG